MPDKIEFAIDAEGQRYWNGERVSREEAMRFQVAEGLNRCSPGSICAPTRTMPYRHVAQTLADATKAGLTRFGFVSQLEP